MPRQHLTRDLPRRQTWVDSLDGDVTLLLPNCTIARFIPPTHASERAAELHWPLHRLGVKQAGLLAVDVQPGLNKQ
jgi:hypothetical protein